MEKGGSESNGIMTTTAEKIHSICLGVEICVVCGDRASGIYTYYFMVILK